MAGIADLLTGTLDVLDMPGSYTRGALAGKFGQRLSGSQLAKEYGLDSGEGVGRFATDMGVGMLTDPLTYALPGVSALLTKGAQKFGTAYKAAAAARGPQYGTTVDELLNIFPKHADWLKDYPGIDKIAKEFPKGSEYLGGGAESMVALHRPTGQVTKIVTPNFSPEAIPPTRLDIADMMQASRSKAFPHPNPGVEDYAGIRVEHEPLMKVGRSATGLPPDAYKAMAKHLSSQGLDPWDIAYPDPSSTIPDAWRYNSGNLGMPQHGSRVMVTDPGAVRGAVTVAGKSIAPRAAEVPMKEPGALMTALLRLTGSDKRIQRQLAKAAKEVRGGSYGTPFNMSLDEIAELAGMTKTSRPPGLPQQDILKQLRAAADARDAARLAAMRGGTPQFSPAAEAARPVGVDDLMDLLVTSQRR